MLSLTCGIKHISSQSQARCIRVLQYGSHKNVLDYTDGARTTKPATTNTTNITPSSVDTNRTYVVILDVMNRVICMMEHQDYRTIPTHTNCIVLNPA